MEDAPRTISRRPRTGACSPTHILYTIRIRTRRVAAPVSGLHSWFACAAALFTHRIDYICQAFHVPMNALHILFEGLVLARIDHDHQLEVARLFVRFVGSVHSARVRVPSHLRINTLHLECCNGLRELPDRGTFYRERFSKLPL